MPEKRAVGQRREDPIREGTKCSGQARRPEYGPVGFEGGSKRGTQKSPRMGETDKDRSEDGGVREHQEPRRNAGTAMCAANAGAQGHGEAGTRVAEARCGGSKRDRQRNAIRRQTPGDKSAKAARGWEKRASMS